MVLILVALGLGIWQWSVRSANVQLVNTYNSEANLLTAELALSDTDYEAAKVEAVNARETASEQLGVVFPTREDITTLTRIFDDFEVKNNFSSNPFFISNISYQDAKEAEGYRYVPLSVSATSSKKNLKKFMEFVETSGSLEGEIRLMSVEDLQVGYPSEVGGTYEAKFTIHAYFSQEI